MNVSNEIENGFKGTATKTANVCYLNVVLRQFFLLIFHINFRRSRILLLLLPFLLLLIFLIFEFDFTFKRWWYGYIKTIAQTLLWAKSEQNMLNAEQDSLLWWFLVWLLFWFISLFHSVSFFPFRIISEILRNCEVTGTAERWWSPSVKLI